MAKQKFRKVEQKPTFTKRDQYENALTPSKLKSRPKKLSYVEIDIGDGETTNVYFLPMTAADVIRFRDPALSGLLAVNMMVDLIADKVVDPYTGEPLQSRDEWAKEDQDFLNQVIGAITGLQFVVEGEEVAEEKVVEIDDADIKLALEELRADPNPLDETVGSSSPTASTLSLEAEAEKEQGMSSDG